MSTSGSTPANAPVSRAAGSLPAVSHASTGVRGLDEVLSGGLPAGRTTLILGDPGAGKTLLGTRFLASGAHHCDEPAILVVVEEPAQDIIANTSAFDWDLPGLVDSGRLTFISAEPFHEELVEAGEYDLGGLFARIGHAVDRTHARRILIDGIGAIAGVLSHQHTVRQEINRLVRWLSSRQLTAVITGAPDDPVLMQTGGAAYICDCVIHLSNRLEGQVSTRRLRVSKFRGSDHSTDEHPFMIDTRGIHLYPMSDVKLDYPVSAQRVSTGVGRLDEMLGGEGYFKGSTVLVSGSSGTGKSSLGAHLVMEACSRGERALYLSFEEPAQQLQRNFRSIGLDLQRHLDSGLLRIEGVRPARLNLEMHFVRVQSIVEEFEPSVAVLDPVSGFGPAGPSLEVRGMLARLVDHLKSRGVTTMLTALTAEADSDEHTHVGLSSIVDVWILLRDIESAGERNKSLFVLKARGMEHSTQVREFIFSPEGIRLVDVYQRGDTILTGSARAAQEAADAAAEQKRKWEIEHRRREIERRRRAMERQVAELRSQFEVETETLAAEIDELEQVEQSNRQERERMRRRRSSSESAE